MAVAAASQTDTLVALNDVHKIYQMGDQQVRALAGVTLNIRRGTFCAIMGSSGSGKSTMLNLLGCLDRPSRGTYFLEGHNVGTMNDDDLSELRLRRLGFIFQSFNLIPQLTVQENIALPLFYLGWEPERSARHASQLAATVGLDARLNHRPSELSGGQQQRVAIARALANDPAIILADEPTGNLDSKTGVQIMQMLTDLNQQGKTLLMVTHEPDIAAFASVQIHMRDGRVERVEGDL